MYLICSVVVFHCLFWGKFDVNHTNPTPSRVIPRWGTRLKERNMENQSNFNKEDWEVRPISAEDCKGWFLFKHYAHRMPTISYAFGLFKVNGGGTN